MLRISRKKNNGNGNGTIFKLSNGKWKAAFVIGYDSQTGKQIRKSKTSKKRQDAIDCVDDMKIKYGKAPKGAINTSNKLFCDAAEEYFNAQIERAASGACSSYTVSLRKGIYMNHIYPVIGNCMLSKITAEMLQDFLNSLMDFGLSRTIGIAKTIIVQIFSFAVTNGYCKVNPADALTLPKKWSNYTESGFRSNLRRFIKQNEDCFSVDGLCNHSFRHAYATNMLDAGFPIRVIQSNLGHACTKTTFDYIGSEKFFDKVEAANHYEKFLIERNQAIQNFDKDGLVDGNKSEQQ